MALPANTPVLDSGVPNRAAGLPKTATAATLSAPAADSDGADPMLPTRSPSGGTPANMETAAARATLTLAAKARLLALAAGDLTSPGFEIGGDPQVPARCARPSRASV